MSKANKILVFILMLLLLVLVGEVGYYWGARKLGASSTATSFSLGDQGVGVVQESLPDNTVVTSQNEYALKINPERPTAFKAITEYKGRVVRTDTKGGVTARNIQYQTLIEIVNERNEHNTFIYRVQDMAGMRVIDTQSTPPADINFSDLNENDIVIITHTYDLKQPCDLNQCLVSVEIVRSNQ